MAKKAIATAPAVPPQTFVQTRTKGLQLLNALQPPSLLKVTSIDTQEGYLEMDAVLARIKNTRAQWTLAMEPISGPLTRAIAHQKAALAEAKKAAEGATQLFNEVAAQLDRIEAHCKSLMQAFKVEEARQIREAELTQAREAQQLRDEAQRRAIQAAAAKTPQLKARLEQQRADLERQAEEVASEPVLEMQPVKGASSTSRTLQKPVVQDTLAFLHAMQDYESDAGVYRMGTPPLTVMNHKKQEVAALVEVVHARLMDLYREQPGVVASWPGVVIVDDIQIANR